MTLQQLRCFLVMAEVLHYTKAADKLYISQPSLSYSLAELGKELGVPLFGKTGKKTYLTQYGAAFLPYAKNALEQLSKGEEVVKRISDSTSGSINFGYIHSVSFNIMPMLIDRFYEHLGNQSITFNLHQGTTNALHEQLSDGTIDLALTAKFEGEGIESVPVFNQELFLVVPDRHRLAGMESVSLDEIRGERIISISRGSALRSQLDECFRAAEIEPKSIIEVDDCNSMASFVGTQLGVAIMPKLPSLSNYNVAVLPIRDFNICREVSLHWCTDRAMLPAAAYFRDYVASLDGQIK